MPVSKKAEARIEREKQVALFPEAVIGGQLPPLHLLVPAPPAAGGHTTAVLANGVDRAYPAGHSELLGRIADVGLLVSEVAPGAPPTARGAAAAVRGAGGAPPVPPQ